MKFRQQNYFFVYLSSKEGYTLAQLVEALHYKTELRGFVPDWVISPMDLTFNETECPGVKAASA